MGNLVINHLTFEFNNDSDDHLNSLTNFINAGDYARKHGDNVHATLELTNHTFQWGKFHEDFAYSKWGDIKSVEFWKWMPQPLHQLLTVFFFKTPSGRSDFENINHFIETYNNSHYGIFGCKCTGVSNLDVYNIPSWHQWKIKYFQTHPREYTWKINDDDYLPNKKFSDQILVRELENQNKLNEVVDNKIGVAFHDHIMRHKGHELRAYAVKIGTEVAEANYYIWEETLSNNEAKFATAPRKIFSNIGRNGKKIYISIDHAHGMFEFHDDKGHHQGEKKFDGSYNSGKESSHDLKTLR